MERRRYERTGILDQMTARHPQDKAFHTGSKTLIYLIHGVTGTPAEMLLVGRGLAQRGWDVYIPTLPGHCGRLRDLIRTTEQDWRNHVIAQLNFAKNNYESVFAAGLSVGALLALDAASQMSLNGIGVLSPTFVYDGWNTPWNDFMLPLAMRFIPKSIQHLFFHVDGPPFGIKDPDLQAQIRAAYRRTVIFREWFDLWWPRKTPALPEDKAPASAATGYPVVPITTFVQIQHLIGQVTQSMPRVTTPVLILQAEQDDMTSPRNAQIVYDQIGSQTKEIVLLDDCYHVITVDKQREAVVEHLNHFFAAHAQDQSSVPLPSFAS